MSRIGELEAAVVARIAAALTVPGQAHPKVEVRAWPENARHYKMTHPLGCAMVIYKGAKFNQDQAMAGQRVDMEAEFELGLISRTLREPNAPAPEGAVGAGIYDLLETCRDALLGWQPEHAAGQVRLHGEQFDDYTEGTWGYSVRLTVPLVLIAQRQCPPGPWADAGLNACCDTAPPLTDVYLTHP